MLFRSQLNTRIVFPRWEMSYIIRRLLLCNTTTHSIPPRSLYSPFPFILSSSTLIFSIFKATSSLHELPLSSLSTIPHLICPSTLLPCLVFFFLISHPQLFSSSHLPYISPAVLPSLTSILHLLSSLPPIPWLIRPSFPLLSYLIFLLSLISYPSSPIPYHLSPLP